MQKKLVLHAKETGITYNYSQLKGPWYGYGVQWLTQSGLQGRYYQQQMIVGGTPGDYPFARFEYMPVALRTLVSPFVVWVDTSNQLVMKSGMENFFGTGTPNWGSCKILSYGDASLGKIQLNFGMYTDPGQHVTYAYNSGFSNSNPSGYPTASPEGWGGINPNTGPGYVINDAAHEYRPNLMFLSLTMMDNEQDSPTYGKSFPVVMVIRHCYGSGEQTPDYDEFSIMDSRLFSESAVPVTNGANPKKNSTANGWGGNRSTASSSDQPTLCPNAIKNSVNFGTYGIHLYECDTDNINDLSGVLFNEYVKHIFSKWEPITGILSLHKLPYSPDKMSNNPVQVHIAGRYAEAHGTEYKAFQGIEEAVDTGDLSLLHILPFIPGNYDDYNYKCEGTEIYGGQEYCSDTIQINPFFGSFLDFEPHTKVQVRLPFIGTVSVPTSACMGGYLKVNYILDNRNGNCVAQILCQSMRNGENDDSQGFIIVGQYSGNCALPAALSGNSTGGEARIGAVRGFASSAAAIGAGVALGAVSGTLAATGLIGSATTAALQYGSATSRPDIVGSINCEAACMEDLTVRVLITRPVDVTPGDFKLVGGERVFGVSSLVDQKGLASYAGGTVSQYEGMTIGYIRGEIDGATEAEMNEIKNAFLGGVIV